MPLSRCDGASIYWFRVFTDMLLHLENKRFARDVETKRVFRPPDSFRVWMDVVGYAGDLLGVGKHQSCIRMQLSCVRACAMFASMTMFRFCNDMLLHITNRRFARARSSETNFLIPAVGALQAPCKNACFIAMGALFPKKLRSRLSAVHTF